MTDEIKSSTELTARMFDFDGNDMTVLIDADGEIWWVAKEICRALGFAPTRISELMGRLDDDEKGYDKIVTPGGMQNCWIINESGLYTLVMRSNKSKFKKIRKWVTKEVLPSIRKTGSYSVGPIPVPAGLPDFLDPSAAARAWADEHDGRLIAETKRIEAEGRADKAETKTGELKTLLRDTVLPEVRQMKPKAISFDRFMASKRAITLTNMANLYAGAHPEEIVKLAKDNDVPRFKVSVRTLCDYLRKERIIQKRRHNPPFQHYVDIEWFTVKNSPDGYPQTFVLPAGVKALIDVHPRRMLEVYIEKRKLEREYEKFYDKIKKALDE